MGPSFICALAWYFNGCIKGSHARDQRIRGGQEWVSSLRGSSGSKMPKAVPVFTL